MPWERDRSKRLGISMQMLGIIILGLTLLSSALVGVRAQKVDTGALQQQVNDNKTDIEEYKQDVHSRFDAQDRHLTNIDSRVQDLEQALWEIRGGLLLLGGLQTFGLLRSWKRRENGV